MRKFICISEINPMESYNFKNQHTRHCLVYEFWNDSKAMQAFKVISSACTDAVKARVC